MLSLYSFFQSHVPSSASCPNTQTALGLCSSLNTTYQFSQLHKSIRRFMVNIYLFTQKTEDKILWTERQWAFLKINLIVLSSCLQFWLVTAVTKYLKFVIFSKSCLSIFNSFMLSIYVSCLSKSACCRISSFSLQKLYFAEISAISFNSYFSGKFLPIFQHLHIIVFHYVGRDNSVCT